MRKDYSFEEKDRSRIRDNDFYRRWRFHEKLYDPHAMDDNDSESFPYNERAARCWNNPTSIYASEDYESTVVITRKSKSGEILEESSYTYKPNKKD